MNKIQKIVKLTLKAILWVALIFAVLFIIVALFIQIPVVQTKIVQIATSYISNKTKTKVEIQNVRISFPKSVVIGGVFLEDLKKDTLIYANEVEINISFLDILFNKITLNSVLLDGVYLNLHSSETDSIFNYNFLLTAFSDSIAHPKTTSKTPSVWTLNANFIHLKNIRIRYDDNYGGINAALSLNDLQLKMEKIDLDNLVFELDELLVDNLDAKLLIKNTTNSKGKTSESKLPFVRANHIQINNSEVSYCNSVGGQTAFANLSRLEVTNGSVDLEYNLVDLNKIYLSNCNFRYKTSETNALDEAPKSVAEALPNSWKVTVKSVELNENSLAYDVANTPAVLYSFDANHVFLQHIALEAENIDYSSDQILATIHALNAIDKNKFIITGLSAVFSMDNTSVTAKKLKLSTPHSSIEADMNLQYESLSKLKESLPSLILNIDVKGARVANSDILYFNPELGKQDFFKNRNNATTFSGMISGSVGNMVGRKLVVTTGGKTKLITNFRITGLPDFETALYDFPNLHVISGKKDLLMIAGSSIPPSIELPDNMEMKVVFKGKIKDFKSVIDLKSSFGSGHLVASIDKDENFKANLNIPTFDLGSLMKNKEMYGPVSMVTEAVGHGLDPKTLTANITSTVSQIYLNKYNYHNLTVNGTVSGREFAGKFNLKDENAELDFGGFVNMNPNSEQYKFNLNVQGIDLRKLNFSNKDLRISFAASTDLKGSSVKDLNGNMKISNVIIAHSVKKYLFDSLLVTFVNKPQLSEMNVRSALVDLKYSGTLSPMALPVELTQFFNSYFPFTAAKPAIAKADSSNFKFEIQLYNHPVLSEVFFSELLEFEPGLITGSFDRDKRKLLLNGTVKKIVYGSTELNNLALEMNSDFTALNYKFSSSAISNSFLNLANFQLDGRMADNRLSANISSIDKLEKKLLIRSEITKNNDNYKLVLDPNEFYLLDNRWDIASDNYVEFGTRGFLIHHLFMNNATEQINIASVNNKFNDDIRIAIENFKLEAISQIVEKDSGLLKGHVDGNVLLKRVNKSYGIIADANISDLFFRNIPLGNLVVKADNPTSEKFNIGMRLSGIENNLTANGYFVPNGGENSLSIKTAIQSLSMKTVQAFSMGELAEASGSVSGSFDIGGSTTDPLVTGKLVFDNAFITPMRLNNRLELKHETVELKLDGIYFDSFTLLDSKKHPAVINGKVKMKKFSDFDFGLHVNSKDFLLFNTTSTFENSDFYGRMIVDSDIDITGPLSLPVINARVKMKKGSNFSFVVPEDELTTDRGENVMEFDDSLQINAILNRSERNVQTQSKFIGFDLSSIIEVDKDATLKLLLDPTSTDSLVVRGEAALSFTMDKSGKMSLTGAYNLNEGSYLVSLESVIKKKFDIVPGSTIIWNGDPLDAEISINTSYSVRATPIDLVSNQMVDATDADKAGYKQPYPFLVLLKLRGPILQPEISFEIQLAPEDKGILGGAVYQKLLLLNEDPSALNKQVFALLVMGRFVPENPLQSESGSTESLVRSTVGNFLSAQLNRLSSKVLPGMEMNFDIQSYSDYQSGEAQGRTQVEIGVKKQLFDERLSVEVGGKVDVEGVSSKENSVSDIAGDVTVEYKLVKDGSYRIKAFRHNQYEGAIEGQLVETGVGVVYVKNFDKWGKKKGKKSTSKSTR